MQFQHYTVVFVIKQTNEATHSLISVLLVLVYLLICKWINWITCIQVFNAFRITVVVGSKSDDLNFSTNFDSLIIINTKL